MAMLSGYGAVSTPYKYLSIYFSRVTSKSISELREQIEHLLTTIEKRREMLRSALHSSLSEKQSSGFSSYFGFGSATASQRAEVLELQITDMQNLLAEMEEEIVERTEILERQNDSKTWKGHIFTPLGYALSVFCAYKIITASLNVILHRKRTIDPVTRVISILLTFFSPAFSKESGGIDVEMWSQTISFVFVGILMTVSVRGFLLKASFLVRKLSSEASSNMSLFLGQVLGSYFISSILLMRMNLPPQYRTIITSVVGDIDFDYFHRRFDLIFIPSVIVSGIYLYYTYKQRQLWPVQGGDRGFSGV